MQNKFLTYSRQTVSNTDIKAVISVLKSDFLTNGSKIEEFENSFSKFVGSKYAVAVSSGTAALHLACLAVGLKKNEELITSPMTFAASANCALYCGAKPVFVDINKQGLIAENKIKEKITKNTKIILPVHYAGLPSNLEVIKLIADKYNLIVIEDGCHALGTRYKNSQIGDCKYSDMVIFSFHPVKHITTGEGGMITTNNKKYYKKLLLLRNHGINRNHLEFNSTSKLKGDWWYEMQDLGFNYRLTDIQCALGLSQLTKIEKFILRRREIATFYNKTFKDNPNIEIIKENNDQFNSYHLYPILLKNEKLRYKLFNYLKKNNIYCQVHYIPVYWHPYYKKIGYKKGICPDAENFYQRVLSLPLYPLLANADLKRVICKITNFFNSINAN